MAEQEAEQQAQGGSKKNIILFATALVIAIGASVGGTSFILSETEEEAVADVAPVSNKPVTAIYHGMRPPYIVNYVTGAKSRYLQAEFTIMSRNETAIETVIWHMPLIRSEIISFLTEQNFLELQTQEGKEAVRLGIVEIVNNILVSYDVQPDIESVLITNFVLQ